MSEKLKKWVASVFGIEVSDVTEEFVTDLAAGARKLESAPAVVALLDPKQEKIDEYAALLEANKGEIETLNKKVTGLEVEAKLGAEYLGTVRAEAEKYYRLTVGENASDAIVEMMKGATLDQATAFCDQFKKEADKKIPLKCEKCGATEVSRASSADLSGTEAGDEGGDGSTESDSNSPKIIV